MFNATLSNWITWAVLTAVLSGCLYAGGRVDGWDRRGQAQQAADYAALRQAQSTFLVDLQHTLQDGEEIARITGDWRQTLGGIRNELSRLSAGADCPSDPDRSVLIDHAVGEANATLRAAGAGHDGAAEGDNPDHDTP
ncbi:hypothetical protein [uncultured Maricaulis sp.]|uniref:hypothetical protein n=1 Tax=uncultured Maricaulis sp. TaxID=174710 RepID=UPI0030D86AC0|tara:strand:- start:118660 stop:119073 length:414 start_codon:yes stop_codon:yes gene_type:complete